MTIINKFKNLPNGERGHARYNSETGITRSQQYAPNVGTFYTSGHCTKDGGFIEKYYDENHNFYATSKSNEAGAVKTLNFDDNGQVASKTITNPAGVSRTIYA